ncbi:MAG: hypothetical protein VB912_17080 [Pirellulaceae bacterium]
MSDEFDPYREWLGLAPDEHPVDHYRLLGLERFENDPTLVHQAADACMNKVRLHQTGPRGRHTQQLLNEIAAARVCLADAASKQAYDSQLTNEVTAAPQVGGVSAAQVPPPAPPRPPPAPLTGGQIEMATVAPVTSTTTVEEELEETRGGWGKVVLGLFAVLLIAGGIWGLGWWAGRQDTTEEQVQKKSDEQKKDLQEDLSTEVVVYQEGTGEIGLAAIVATLHGKTIRCEVNGTEGQIASWTDPQDWVSWKFKVLEPGYFKAEVTYAAAQDAHQGTYRIQIDEEPSKACDVQSPMGTTGRTDEYFFFINRSGTHVLSVKAGKKPGKELMVLKSIRLYPK